MKLNAVPVLIVALTSAFALNTQLSVAAADGIVTSVQRFSCGAAGANASYISVPSGDGLGPTKQFVDANLAGVNPPGPATRRNAGYVAIPFDLKPPSEATGFRSFSLNFKDQLNGIASARVDVTFQIQGGQVTRVSKPFSAFRLTPKNQDGFQVLSADSDQLGGSIFRMANMTKFVVYVETQNSQAQMLFGDVNVNTGQGRYVLSIVKFDHAPCPVVGAPI